jgi:hypothetical protein
MMPNGREREELRPHLRGEPPPSGQAVVVRGGPDTVSLIRSHARRLHRLYCLDGEPLWGVSVFVIRDADNAARLLNLLGPPTENPYNREVQRRREEGTR